MRYRSADGFLRAAIEEFAADGFTHVECLPSMSRDQTEADELVPAHLDGLSVGASMLLSCELDSGGAGNRRAQGQLTFQTLDGDTQQVNSEEIWRIPATSTSDEPPGAIVIDYAFERVYVKEDRNLPCQPEGHGSSRSLRNIEYCPSPYLGSSLLGAGLFKSQAGD